MAGNTDLKGAVIAASDNAIANNQNTFATGGTLAMSDIQNSASYEANASGFSAGVGSMLGASGGTGSDSGNAQSVTRSGIGVSTNTDTTNVIKPIFDANAVTNDINAQVQITQAFSQAAPKAVASFADGQKASLENQAKQLPADDPKKQALLDEAQKWGDGGTYRVALHTISGALGGGVTGALGAAVSASAAPLMNELQTKATAALIEKGISPETAVMIGQGLAEATSAGMGAAIGGTQGAATAMTVDTNNRQLHIANFDRLRSSCKGSNSTECQTINRMAGVKSGMPTEDLLIPESKVVANYDANNNVVSYTILDKNTNQPTMIMEPLEFAAFQNAPAGDRALMQLSPQYALDFASATLYASTENSARAWENLMAGVTSRDYVRDVALGVAGAAVSAASVVKPVTGGVSLATRPNFYVTADGVAVPGTGYRATGGAQNILEASQGTVSPRNPTYFTFDNITNMSGSQIKDLLQLEYPPTHVLTFDTRQILQDINIPGGRWNTLSAPEPLTSTFPGHGNGGGTQAITNSPIKIDQIAPVIKP